MLRRLLLPGIGNQYWHSPIVGHPSAPNTCCFAQHNLRRSVHQTIICSSPLQFLPQAPDGGATIIPWQAMSELRTTSDKARQATHTAPKPAPRCLTPTLVQRRALLLLPQLPPIPLLPRLLCRTEAFYAHSTYCSSSTPRWPLISVAMPSITWPCEEGCTYARVLALVPRTRASSRLLHHPYTR